ncbi:hypothetical protein OQY15_17760 [Pedobacter sp. MC2016-15]|uniref:hypothetical protein n=1 Tax=Pedobacter sp. MC2016-15 TaxID=2994473 RepID=UPI0022481340|nr:hypothetical protein [Pedobacter sp. MC2016-15]MCX2480956.1 hypothetical protein [Pedobacter sp. MC2016-15]
MKRAWTMIIVLAILTQITELRELSKLPLLFEHFSEHQQRNPSVTFVDFLSMHYWGDDLDDNDDNRDMQLPFKKLDVHTVQLHYLPPMSGVKIKSAVFRIDLDYSAYRPFYTPDIKLSVPFRPPCA